MTSLDAAAEFLWTHARLLERQRFARAFLGGGSAPVVRALEAHRNEDGGFGHALEPDLRGPASQPAAGQTALEVLHEVGVRDERLVGGACAFLAAIARPDGGIPFALPSALEHPHAPWWQARDASSLTQTAANAAVLYALGRADPWLDGASAFCWERIGTLDFEHARPDPGLGYDARFAVAFLDAVPDAERAERALDALKPGLLRSGLVALEPGAPGEVQTPLDLSPWPGARSRRLFAPAVIERHLDALAAGQQPDGGWTFPWAQWSPAATLEWRGIVTLHALRVLRANGRIERAR